MILALGLILLVVVLPVVVILLKGVLDEANGDRPERRRASATPPAPAPRTSTPCRCC